MKANLACNCSGKEEKRKKKKKALTTLLEETAIALNRNKLRYLCYIYVEGGLQLLIGISEVTLTWVNRVLRAFTFYQYARDR